MGCSGLPQGPGGASTATSACGKLAQGVPEGAHGPRDKAPIDHAARWGSRGAACGERAAAWSIAAPRRAHRSKRPRWAKARAAALVQGLGALNWHEGRNLRIDWRWAGGDTALYERYAAELVVKPQEVIPG